jgi:hypothetical protein
VLLPIIGLLYCGVFLRADFRWREGLAYRTVLAWRRTQRLVRDAPLAAALPFLDVEEIRAKDRNLNIPLSFGGEKQAQSDAAIASATTALPVALSV